MNDPMNWEDARLYCHCLFGWRLPTIDELRSLVRGCPGTMAGGACGITDTCYWESCWNSPCNGCSYGQGPGEAGCYWDVALGESCSAYWSVTVFGNATSSAWAISFVTGALGEEDKDALHRVRCVHDGP